MNWQFDDNVESYTTCNGHRSVVRFQIDYLYSILKKL